MFVRTAYVAENYKAKSSHPRAARSPEIIAATQEAFV
jgi:hypothetical protein